MFIKTTRLVVFVLSSSSAIVAAADYKYTVFDVDGAPATFAFGIDNLGRVVGGTGAVGFVDAGGRFTDIKMPGARSTQAYGINDIGQVVGFYNEGTRFSGFLKTGDTYEAVSKAGSVATFCFGINKSGRIVGNYATSDGEYGYTYLHGAMTTISVPDAEIAKGSGTHAHGINNRDQVVGFYNRGRDRSTGKALVSGFVDSDGKVETFDVPGAYATEADGINDRGEIVGTYGTNVGGFGFLYARGVFTTLAVPGASKTEAQGINDSGQIVGWEETKGKKHGFVATRIPDPVAKRQ